MDHTLEIRDNLGGPYPTHNPHVGKFRTVQSVYLGAPSIPGSSPDAWYLLTDPADLPIIQVVFLYGRENPVIEQAEADFATLGIQMRGFHDFGIRKQDPRGGIMMMGK